jgi:hypothetical protein
MSDQNAIAPVSTIDTGAIEEANDQMDDSMNRTRSPFGLAPATDWTG